MPAPAPGLSPMVQLVPNPQIRAEHTQDPWSPAPGGEGKEGTPHSQEDWGAGPNNRHRARRGQAPHCLLGLLRRQTCALDAETGPAASCQPEDHLSVRMSLHKY